MTEPRRYNPERFLSASELGEYAYCRRAWWLRSVKVVTTAEQGHRFQRGHDAHRRHGRVLLWARLVAVVAALALLAALAIALMTARRGVS